MKIKQLVENNEYFWPVVGAEAVKFPNNQNLTEIIEGIASSVPSGVFASVEYDTEAKSLKFYDSEDNLVSTLDVTNFIKDGMLDTMVVDGDYLVATFNPAADKEPIRIPLSSIFNVDNYYTKEQVDENITNILAEIDTITSEDVDNIISGIFPEPRLT
jgi:hypothetical protein